MEMWLLFQYFQIFPHLHCWLGSGLRCVPALVVPPTVWLLSLGHHSRLMLIVVIKPTVEEMWTLILRQKFRSHVKRIMSESFRKCLDTVLSWQLDTVWQEVATEAAVFTNVTMYSSAVDLSRTLRWCYIIGTPIQVQRFEIKIKKSFIRFTVGKSTHFHTLSAALTKTVSCILMWLPVFLLVSTAVHQPPSGSQHYHYDPAPEPVPEPMLPAAAAPPPSAGVSPPHTTTK